MNAPVYHAISKAGFKDSAMLKHERKLTYFNNYVMWVFFVILVCRSLYND